MKIPIQGVFPNNQTDTITAFIGNFIGAQFAAFVISDSTLRFGLTSLIAGIAFSPGLMLVVVGGAELFTGSCLIIMGYISKGFPKSLLLLEKWQGKHSTSPNLPGRDFL